MEQREFRLFSITMRDNSVLMLCWRCYFVGFAHKCTDNPLSWLMYAVFTLPLTCNPRHPIHPSFWQHSQVRLIIVVVVIIIIIVAAVVVAFSKLNCNNTPCEVYISHKCQSSSEQIEYFVCARMISSIWHILICTIQLNYSHLFFTRTNYKLTFYWKSIVDSSQYFGWG